MTRVLIAVPCMDMVAAGFAASLAMLQKNTNDIQCQVSFLCGSLIYDARNKISAQAIKFDADYVMWFDSDMTFDPDTMVRLFKDLEEHEDIDIVSGLYFRRSAPYTPVAFDKIFINEETNESTHEDYHGELSGLHEVGAVGFGCVLMKTDVLVDCFAEYGTCFDPIGHFGEDLSFCWRASKLGYKVALDCDVKCGHIGHITSNQSFYEAWTEAHNESKN